LANSEEKFQTPKDSLEFEKEVEARVRERDCPILETEKTTKNFYDWWNS
jgi:hypothetical protein